MVVFVLDSEHSVAYLQHDQLEGLRLSPEEALELAKTNLARSFSPEVVRAAIDDRSMNVVKSMDTYDAARLLLVPDVLRQGESLAAIIPDRETLVLAPLPTDGDWRGLEKLARTADGDSLWTYPLVVTSAGVSAVEP